jgi:sterol desaturase/sphingolipid hydroxylase (fatty acid hydroxylase superfamily)
MSAVHSIENALFLIAMSCFTFILLLEKKQPHRKVTSCGLKRSLSTNTTAFFFNSVTTNILSVTSLFVVAATYSRYGLLSGWAAGPLKWIVSFIAFDFAVYAWHFLGHKSYQLWRFHKIHHSDKIIHVSTGLRFHVFDQLLEVVFKCACMVVIGVESHVVIVCELVRMLFVFFHHANLSFHGEKWLSYIVITPALHRVHHSTLRSEHDSNFGIVLSVWDILFGTRKELVPKKIGLELIEAENFLQLFSLAFVSEGRFAKMLHLLPRLEAAPAPRRATNPARR